MFYREKSIIKTHLQQIVEEAEFNKVILENSIIHNETNNKKIDTIFNLVNDEDFIAVNSLSLDLLHFGVVRLRRNAYLSLTESGGIKFLKDFKKKQQVIDLYEHYKWVDLFYEISYRMFSTDFYPYLRENFDLVEYQTQQKAIYKNKEYLNILSTYKITNGNKIIKYKDCLKEIEKYLSEE